MLERYPFHPGRVEPRLWRGSARMDHAETNERPMLSCGMNGSYRSWLMLLEVRQ